MIIYTTDTVSRHKDYPNECQEWYKCSDVQNLLNLIASMCGNPDPAEACRLILKEIGGE